MERFDDLLRPSPFPPTQPNPTQHPNLLHPPAHSPPLLFVVCTLHIDFNQTCTHWVLQPTAQALPNHEGLNGASYSTSGRE